jgi:hypothetical protein
MKKMYSILISLVLVLGVFSTIAYAQSGSHEKIDLTAFSLEELIELNDDVHAELADRLHLIEDTLIGRSEYIVGQQVKPGIYTLTVAESNMYEEGGENNSILVQDINDSKYLSTTYDAPVGGKVVLVLEEGQKLRISGCTCYLAISNPIWAP